MRRFLLLAALSVAPVATAADWWVDPVVGVDDPAGGTPVTPWRTLGYAASRSASGDTIHLAAGLYDGEPASVRVDGLQIIGAGPDRTILPGGPQLWASWEPVVVEGILFDGWLASSPPGALSGPDLQIRRCRFRGYDRAVLSPLFGNLGGRYRHDIADSWFEDNAVAVDTQIGPPGPNPEFWTNVSQIVNTVFVRNGIVFGFLAPGPDGQWFLSGPDLVANNVFAFYDQLSQVYSSPDRVANNVFAWSTGYGYRGLGPGWMAGNLYFANALGDFFSLSRGVLTVPEVNALPSHDPDTPSIGADPLLVDPANGDFRLQTGSPCIDAAANSVAPATDADGNPRPLDGDGDGVATADIGAYEAPQLRLALIEGLAPVSPPLAQVFPFGAANPLTPVALHAFSPGARHTPPAAALTLYQVSPGRGTILVIRDSADPGTVVLFER